MRFEPNRAERNWRRNPCGAPDASDHVSGRGDHRSAGGGPRFVAICEIGRFEAIRRNVGYGTTHALLMEVVAVLEAGLAGVEIGRVQRASIEFVFDARDADEAGAHLARLVAGCKSPIRVDGCTFALDVRFGYALLEADVTGNELIERIEVSLQAAGQAARPVIHASRAIADDTTLRLGLLRDLHHAIETDGLDLHYQPKVRCRTHQVDSVEALLRWRHPRLGMVSPDLFVTMAEETGLIGPLTDWVLLRAIEDQRRMAEAGHDLTVYINVSGLVLPDPGFAGRALGLLAQAPGSIGFEITETAVIDEPDRALAHLHAFKDAGIRIAIDDYGSGLSSLAYLKQLPAHELKIDRMFVKGLTETQRDPLLVRSSIDLAHALEMEVTAEGVDDQMSLSLLRVMGCDMMQGFLISHPLPLDELRTFLAENRHRAALDATATTLAGWNAAALGAGQG